MTTTARPASATAGQRTVTAVSHVVLSLWTLVIIIPLLWTLVSSFKTSTEIFESPMRSVRSLQTTSLNGTLHLVHRRNKRLASLTRKLRPTSMILAFILRSPFFD